MFWWMWIVLWAALLALSALFLLAVGFRVFRKAMATLGEFEAAAARLDPAPEPVSAGTGAADARGGSRVPAVFSHPGEVRAANREAKLLRQARRREQRVRRRAEHRRPQLLHDLPHL
jgi:hypothetical protein